MHYTDYIMGLSAHWKQGSNVYHITDEDSGVTTTHAVTRPHGQPWLVLRQMREHCEEIAKRKER